MADIGQRDNFEEARKKALGIGASKVFIEVSHRCWYLKGLLL
jgi:argininosuccinate synthase